MTDTTTIDIAELCVRSVHLMGNGTVEELAEVIHPDCVNREAKDEPPASRGRGPAAIHATALWLREAFAELRWEIHDVIVQGDLVALHCTMRGRHVKPFVGYGADARPKEAFPPTGREFASTQSHWFRIRDGLIAEHWANRDDLGTAEQLGWVPPTPLYLVKMALAKRRARRLSPR
jgi:predicted ester cyclase